jgi:hypothetical protein
MLVLCTVMYKKILGVHETWPALDTVRYIFLETGTHCAPSDNTTACPTLTMMCMHCSHWCIYDIRKIQSCSTCHRLLNAAVLNVEVVLNVV